MQAVLFSNSHARAAVAGERTLKKNPTQEPRDSDSEQRVHRRCRIARAKACTSASATAAMAPAPAPVAAFCIMMFASALACAGSAPGRGSAAVHCARPPRISLHLEFKLAKCRGDGSATQKKAQAWYFSFETFFPSAVVSG